MAKLLAERRNKNKNKNEIHICEAVCDAVREWSEVTKNKGMMTKKVARPKVLFKRHLHEIDTRLQSHHRSHHGENIQLQTRNVLKINCNDHVRCFTNGVKALIYSILIHTS